ncbi:hypothetical protein Hypma_005073 [Hypsizygus marmoreus]|uniref:Uncharacterized protein n=1 Tax=Hypsizygus marmoreus TaxID=39966 RepID=A0A369K588_HYPMA|nr:hypothetical protein Hypma_005073 [Hypsizygus marmoreus]
MTYVSEDNGRISIVNAPVPYPTSSVWFYIISGAQIPMAGISWGSNIIIRFPCIVYDAGTLNFPADRTTQFFRTVQ